MQDVMEGTINCIIVKDLSRLGREYIETGRYLRRVFPSYGVRFIAITDGIDTAHDERFLGHYVQGVRTVTEIGGHRIRKKAKDKWCFVPDHHEPIVDQELFDKAHERQIRFNQKNKKTRNTPLCGKVICGCCNASIA